jgi:uncharacterized protein (TIGR00251 family)
MATLAIQKVDEGAVFTVKIVPGGSSPTQICGLLGEILKIKVAAPPEKGKANRCLIEFLAEKLGVKKNAVSIISGRTSPVKHVKVSGISPETILQKLNPSRAKSRDPNKISYSQ